jgi:HSP20 family molecular chaperone IbpA
MEQCLTQSWRQLLERWYHALRRTVGRRWGYRRVPAEGEPGWFSSLMISGGPVRTVEETEADVIIITTFPQLVSAEVTLELAGDRLLIQGRSASESAAVDTCTPRMAGSYAIHVHSAILPCAVHLAQARIMQKNDTVQITLPKCSRGFIRSPDGKG